MHSEPSAPIRDHVNNPTDIGLNSIFKMHNFSTTIVITKIVEGMTKVHYGCEGILLWNCSELLPALVLSQCGRDSID